MRSEFESRTEKHLKHIDELLEEKVKFNERSEMFIADKKKFEKILNDQKEKFANELKNAKEAWAVLEKERREKWEKQKVVELK